jgi:hypothetical protein
MGQHTEEFLEQAEHRLEKARVTLPEVGQVELDIPPFFITPKLIKGEVVGWKLVNPMTEVRNIATRKGELAIKMTRGLTEKPELKMGRLPAPTLDMFSKADQRKIVIYYRRIRDGVHREYGVENKPRGRPVYLRKNAEFHGIKFDPKTKTVGNNPKKGFVPPPESPPPVMSPEVGEDRRIKWVANPFKAGSKAHARYEGFKNTKTTAEARRAGATNIDFRYSRRRGAGLRSSSSDSVSSSSSSSSDSSSSSSTLGAGILGDLANKVIKKANKVKNITNDILFGRKTVPPSVAKILNEDGDAVIESATVGRTPVQALITGIIKFVSSTPYEKLFHLFIILHTTKGDIRLEKNEVVSMAKAGLPKDAESLPVVVPAGLTVKQLVDNTEKKMGKNFLTYSAKGNNCQDFIMAMLESNDMLTPELSSFVKQNTEEIFKEPAFRKFANTVTDIAGRANVLLEGGAINYKLEAEYEDMLNSKQSERNGLKGKPNTEGDVMRLNKEIAEIQKKIHFLRQHAKEHENYPDWEHMKWGSFTKQFERYRQQYPDAKGDLETFARTIITNPKDYHKRTVKRARFYLNVLLKKKSKPSIMKGHGMPKKMGHPALQSPDANMVYHPNAHINIHGNGFPLQTPEQILGEGIEHHFKKVGRHVASTLIHRGIPLATRALATTGASALSANPLLGAVAGQAGQYGGEKLAEHIGRETGYGLKRFKKGSKEAKEYMASIRKKKMKGGMIPSPPSRLPFTAECEL